MGSGNDGSRPKGESFETEGQPPSYEGRDGQSPHVREGLYILTNKKARSTLDLSEGMLFHWHPVTLGGAQAHVFAQKTLLRVPT